MLSHLEVFNHIPRSAVEVINKFYELPSIKPEIRYLRGAFGFPKKAPWLKIIQKGNYITWPLINVKNVNKLFPESEETQKGHMRNQRQVVRSTQKPNSDTDLNSADIIELPPIEKIKDIYITTYNPRHTMFSNQTVKLPHTSSKGKNYQMIFHEIDINSTWIEPMKIYNWKWNDSIPVPRPCKN